METQGRIVPAAGMFKEVADVERALTLPIDEIYLGSITWDKKEGNKGTVFYDDGAGNFWNAIGLKNDGEAYYRTHLPQIAHMVQEAGRELIVSISGESSDENGKLVRMINESSGPDTTIELNVACPNKVTEGGGRMPIIGYATELVRNHIGAFAYRNKTNRAVRIKVPPYFDAELQRAVAEVIITMSEMVRITHVVATNTMGRCLPLDQNGQPAISVGYAGGSGEQLHSLAVGNVKLWKELLPPTITIRGAGGVRWARHLHNFERGGAVGCQMGGAFYGEGGARALQSVLETM